MGLHFGGHTTANLGHATTNRGNRIIRAATRRRYAASQLLMLQNPHRYRQGDRRGHGEPGRSTHERRQGAAIARQLARGLRQSKTLFAQQQPHRTPSVQNSPSTSRTAPLPVQNSPSTPEMAQFGAFSACRESFVPLSPPRSRAGRILYRTRGRVGASHDSTTCPTSAEGTGETEGRGRGASCGRLVGPARVRRATARQISHIIHHGHFSRLPENVAIPTIHIQCLNKLVGNYVRNYYGGGGAWPGFETTLRAKLAARTTRGRAAAHGRTKQPGPTAGPSGARNTRGASSSPAPSTHTKTPTRNRVGVSEPPVGIEPTTYSLRVNRSAD